MKGYILILLFLLSFTTQAQDMHRVRQTISDLAAPQMHGRGYVQQGDKQAAAYIRQRFQDLGLQALAPGYYQPFTFPVNRFPGTLRFLVDGRPLVPGKDFIAHGASASGSLNGKVLLLDTLAFSQPTAAGSFWDQKLKNKILVLPQKYFAQLNRQPAAWQAKLSQLRAVILLVPGKLTASLADHQAPWPVLEVRQTSWPARTHVLEGQVDATLGPYRTQNVLAYIEGSAQPDSFMVLTAHYDHLGRQGQEVLFPGANDNASGTAMLLELAAWYAQPANRPHYSMAFMAFGAEEAGLIGSAYYTQHPAFPLSRIRFLVNLDLLGAGEEGMMVVNGRILEPEFNLLTRLNEKHRYLPHIKSRGKAANSDHYHFTEKGVPAFFFYTLGGPKAYHDPEDLAANLPLTGFTGVFQLITAFFRSL